MNGLHELQRDFAGFLWSGAPGAFGERIVQNGFTAEQRLSVYRNNTRLGLSEALRSTYPVVTTLVGSRFFERLARDYICDFPPYTGCLSTFGNLFADFLATDSAADTLPYLPDTARLEWLLHEVYFEHDAEGIDASALAGVPETRYGDLRFFLHTAVRLQESRYPILQIWQAHQEPAQNGATMHLHDAGCSLVIYRSAWEAEISAVTSGEYRFLKALASGLTLCVAAESTLNEDPDFNPGRLLGLCLSNAWFGGYSLDGADHPAFMQNTAPADESCNKALS